MKIQYAVGLRTDAGDKKFSNTRLNLRAAKCAIARDVCEKEESRARRESDKKKRTKYNNPYRRATARAATMHLSKSRRSAVVDNVTEGTERACHFRQVARES